ncbi:MAG: amidohydrolase [Bacteroidetes bacterium HGW-Bacteroidetes-5]|jgi:cytosine/adenosine deaminase-related metal-dependent hydrolase|nr:MAG: amidohydrolase [Bacteroidetes bacterium HGW-Bacteroidetes-5]
MRKIAAQYLYPLNSSLPIPKGVLTLDDDGTIVEIGRLSDETESTEFYNGILVPGFVNSHCHIELSHLKDIFDRGTGMSGFIKDVVKLRNNLDENARKEVMRMEMQMLYDSGVTAMADISNTADSFAVKTESPIYTRTFLEFFGTEPSQVDEILIRANELTQKAKEFGLDAAPTPHSSYSMSPQLLQAISTAGLKSGWLSYHNQESWEEEELILKGRGPLAQQYTQRGLSTPPVTGTPSLIYFLNCVESAQKIEDERVLLVHNTFSDSESVEYATSRIRNLFWAICPLSNLFIHNALPPLELLIRYNASITIGTDSLSSNSALSIADEIICIHKYFPAIPLTQILEWSSFNGARFLGIEKRFGSFEVGKRPGVVLIDNIDFQKNQLTTKSKSIRLV